MEMSAQLSLMYFQFNNSISFRIGDKMHKAIKKFCCDKYIYTPIILTNIILMFRFLCNPVFVIQNVIKYANSDN